MTLEQNARFEEPSGAASSASEVDLSGLIAAVTQAVMVSGQTRSPDYAWVIRDHLRSLPDVVTTDVLNGVILNLVMRDPEICRWFILDIFLADANQEGRADVAERINLLLADLQTSG